MTTSSPFTVDAATSASNATYVANQPTSTSGTQNLGMSDFLTLMTTQMQDQDPFSPMDNTQMVAQMAQFSQLSAQTTANTTLQTIADSLSGSRLSDAANWIGKTMLVNSASVAPTTSGAYAGTVTLSGAATDASVDLVDSSGAVVKSIDLGAQSAGAQVPFYWDGKDSSGNATSGALTIKVNGATASSTAAWASVAAVSSPASGSDASLITPLGNFSPSDALSLS